MAEMADIFRATAPEYLAEYGEHILPSHKRAIEDIILCRTKPLGGKSPKYIGGEVGIIAVLQTWRRDMRYHVHAHFIVTGGGLSPDGKRWLPVQGDFLMPQWPLADLFRGKFRDALKKESALYAQVPEKVWRMQWVADVESVGTGHGAVKYLAPYIFRIAISNKRILRFEDGMVTFKWQDNKEHWHTTELEAKQFMSRFLQHVLPKGFVKVRYYGFLATRRRDTLEHIKELFDSAPEQKRTNPVCDSSDRGRIVSCPKCGRPMIFVAEIRPGRSRSP